MAVNVGPPPLPTLPPRIRDELRAGGLDGALHYSRRSAEILLALARRPAGYSAAELSTHLFGDPGRTVTVRAEMSRLRRTIGALLEHRPYRLADHVQVADQRV